jgi:acyl phosphate:glycerol-3-phosphate acyltransferase
MNKIYLLLIFSYFLGAIPFALVVSKLKKVDLRKVGSGNIGATNVYRAMGLKWALLVFLLDGLKGFIPVFLALNMTEIPLFHILAGGIAIVGHSLTVFAKFKGGKGAATGLGVLLALTPMVFVVVVILAALIIKFTRYVSLATIVSSITAPILIYLRGYPAEYMQIIGIICIFIIYRHRSNIGRLIKGKENKV